MGISSSIPYIYIYIYVPRYIYVGFEMRLAVAVCLTICQWKICNPVAKCGSVCSTSLDSIGAEVLHRLSMKGLVVEYLIDLCKCKPESQDELSLLE